MNKKKLTATITVLSCIVCLTACTGNNAGSNSSSDETNGSAIQISNKEESKSEEPAPEPKKGTPNDEKPAGDDAIIGQPETGHVITEQQNKEIEAMKSKFYEYANDKPDLIVYSRSYGAHFPYQEAVISGYCKPDIRKLQVDELKEYLRENFDKDYYIEHPYFDKEAGKLNEEGYFKLLDFKGDMNSWIYEHQAFPDARGNWDPSTDTYYWCDADNLEDVREIIYICFETDSGLYIQYSTFDENGSMVSKEVIMDLTDNIYSF